MSKKKSKPTGWSVPAPVSKPTAVNSAIARAREALMRAFERLAVHPDRERLGDSDPFEVTVRDPEGAPGSTITVHAIVMFEEDDDSLAALLMGTGPRSYAQLVRWLFEERVEGQGHEYPGHAIWRVDLVRRTEVAPSERLRCVGELQLDGEARVVVAGGEHSRHMNRGLDAVKLTLLTDVATAVERALGDPGFEVPGFAPGEDLMSIGPDGGWTLSPCPVLTPAEFASLAINDDEHEHEDEDEHEHVSRPLLSGYRWDELDAGRCRTLGARVFALPIAAERTLVLTAQSRLIPVSSTPEALSGTFVRELVLCDPDSLAELAHMSVERDLVDQSLTDYAADTLEAFVRMVENFVGALPARLVVEPSDLQQLLRELFLHGRGAPAEAPSVELVHGSPRMPAAALLTARTQLTRAATLRERQAQLLTAATAWLQYAGVHIAGITEATLAGWVGTGGALLEKLAVADRDSDLHMGLAAFALIAAFEPTEVTQPWLAEHRALVPLDLMPAVEAWAQFVPDLFVREGEWAYRSLLTGPVADADFDHDEVYEDEEDNDADKGDHAHLVLRVNWNKSSPAIAVINLPRALAGRLVAEQGDDRSPTSLRRAAAPWLRAALLARL